MISTTKRLCTSLRLFIQYDRSHSISWVNVFELHVHPRLVENMVKKEPQLFVHCGSFDHPNLQSQNDYKIFFFLLRLQFKVLGAYNTPLERYSQDLSNGISKASKFLKTQLVNRKKQNLSSFNVYRSRWSKEPQWTNDCGSFLPCFLLQ